MTDSKQLLADYTRTGSDSAFRELVSRYVDLVYSSALRQVEGDAHRAQDITQIVFADLASAASGLSGGVMLGGWLHRHTCFVAANVLRSERRRQLRERQAVEMIVLEDQSDSNFAQVAPIIDEAINELAEADRKAILLRFFEQHDFREVGQAIGSTEDAARMRVTRALEKLGSLLKRRGITTSTALLSVMLSANLVQAAPTGVAAAISGTILLSETAVSTTTATVAKTILMTTLQKSLIATTITLAVGLGIYQTRESSRLRRDLVALQAQQDPLIRHIEQLQSERNQTANRLVLLAEEIERVKGDSSELHKLRGEIGRLRKAAQEFEQLKKGNATVAEAVSWKERVRWLKQHLEQNPNAGIPELQFATEKDWLDAARGELQTEKDYRRAMSELRRTVENRFTLQMQAALKRYSEANEKRFPTELSELQPYFKSPVDPAILQRYAIYPKDEIPVLKFGGDWIISLKGPVDPEFDHRLAIGQDGSSGSTSFQTKKAREAQQQLQNELGPVFKAYMAANGGREPSDPADLLPYIQTPAQRAAYDQAMTLRGNR